MSQRGRGTDRGGYSGRGDRGRDRGGYSPRGDRGGYSPRGDRGGYSPRGDRGGYVPRGDRGGYVPHGDRGGGRGRGGPPPIAINYNSRSFAPVSPDTKAVAIIKPKAVQTKYVTVENLDPNTKLDFVPRPAQPCRIGENIGAITNFFNLKFGSVKVQQFRADIVNFKCKPVELSRNRKIKTMDRVLRRTTSKFDMHNLVYNDGEEIYVPNCKIPDGEFQELIDVDIPSTTDAVEARKADNNPYYVQFKKTVCFEIKLNNCSNTDYKLTLNFLNLFLTQMYRHAPQLGRIVDGEDLDFSRFSAKSNIFFKPYEHVSPEYAIDALRCLYNGVSMSSQLGPRGTAILNVGQVHSIHVRQNLRALDFYCEASGIRSNGVEKYDASSYAQLGMNEMQRKKLHGLLFGLKLTPSYNTDRDFSCCDVPNFNAQTAKVTWLTEKGAVTTSIEQYYLQKYKLPLKYPQLPLIQMNPAAKKIYVPMEYVMVSYRLEQLKKKLDPNQTAVMVTKCTKVPNQKFSEIFDGIEKVQKECEESFKTLDLAIGSQITTVANILPEPRIDANKERNQLAVNKNLPLFSWGIVYASGVDQRMSLLDMKSKAMHIIKETTKYGARFATATPAYEIMNFDTRQDVTTLKKCFDGKIKDGKTHIIIFVISNTTDTECYRKIKMLAEQKEFLGCHSQVITNQVLGKTDPSKPSCRLCQNVAMKIIAKIGGVAKSIIFDNGKLIEIGKLIKCNTDFKKMFFNPADPTIYIGADVIHTSPQDRESDKDRGASIPSIATVVGSVDFDGMKYGVSSRTHSLRDNKDAMETLEHFQSQVKERLMEFRRLTQKSPAHIVVFRDGVSDSQFKITMEQEVSSIQRACSSLSDKYKPTITFMVVQKRHQVRFYEPSRKFDRQGGNAGNLKNGTIIDRDIINPELFDFYAVLHRGILGTSRPCHIYVLYDDWALPAEYVYLLSYYMAYVCTRCESPIGIPAPCYYADLACTRMKNHWMINKSTTKSSMSNGLPELHDNIKNEQFFV